MIVSTVRGDVIIRAANVRAVGAYVGLQTHSGSAILQSANPQWVPNLRLTVEIPWKCRGVSTLACAVLTSIPRLMWITISHVTCDSFSFQLRSRVRVWSPSPTSRSREPVVMALCSAGLWPAGSSPRFWRGAGRCSGWGDAYRLARVRLTPRPEPAFRPAVLACGLNRSELNFADRAGSNEDFWRFESRFRVHSKTPFCRLECRCATASGTWRLIRPSD